MKRHLTDGELRAALDGELDAQSLGHLEDCADCLARQSQLQAKQTQTASRLAFLTPADEPAPVPQKAWARFSQRLSIKKETSMFKKIFAFPVVRFGPHPLPRPARPVRLSYSQNSRSAR